MNNQKINVDDNLEVKFRASELVAMLDYLSKGQFDFVNPIYQFLNDRILQCHFESENDNETETEN